MRDQEIKNALVQAITDIQINSGRSVPQITDDTQPLGGALQGFDSVNAVEASILLSESLGYEIAPDISLFAQGGKALTVSEIVEKISEEIQYSKPRRLNHD